MIGVCQNAEAAQKDLLAMRGGNQMAAGTGAVSAHRSTRLWWLWRAGRRCRRGNASGGRLEEGHVDRSQDQVSSPDWIPGHQVRRRTCKLCRQFDSNGQSAAHNWLAVDRIVTVERVLDPERLRVQVRDAFRPSLAVQLSVKRRWPRRLALHASWPELSHLQQSGAISEARLPDNEEFWKRAFPTPLPALQRELLPVCLFTFIQARLGPKTELIGPWAPWSSSRLCCPAR